MKAPNLKHRVKNIKGLSGRTLGQSSTIHHKLKEIDTHTEARKCNTIMSLDKIHYLVEVFLIE